jgi:hypothetical protein
MASATRVGALLACGTGAAGAARGSAAGAVPLAPPHRAAAAAAGFTAASARLLHRGGGARGCTALLAAAARGAERLSARALAPPLAPPRSLLGSRGPWPPPPRRRQPLPAAAPRVRALSTQPSPGTHAAPPASRAALQRACLTMLQPRARVKMAPAPPAGTPVTAAARRCPLLPCADDALPPSASAAEAPRAACTLSPLACVARLREVRRELTALRSTLSFAEESQREHTDGDGAALRRDRAALAYKQARLRRRAAPPPRLCPHTGARRSLLTCSSRVRVRVRSRRYVWTRCSAPTLRSWLIIATPPTTLRMTRMTLMTLIFQAPPHR